MITHDGRLAGLEGASILKAPSDLEPIRDIGIPPGGKWGVALQSSGEKSGGLSPIEYP